MALFVLACTKSSPNATTRSVQERRALQKSASQNPFAFSSRTYKEDFSLNCLYFPFHFFDLLFQDLFLHFSLDIFQFLIRITQPVQRHFQHYLVRLHGKKVDGSRRHVAKEASPQASFFPSAYFPQ